MLRIDPFKPETSFLSLEKFIEYPELQFEEDQLAGERVLQAYSSEVIGGKTEEVYRQIIREWPHR